jgi:hypothetical protein
LSQRTACKAPTVNNPVNHSAGQFYETRSLVDCRISAHGLISKALSAAAMGKAIVIPKNTSA